MDQVRLAQDDVKSLIITTTTTVLRMLHMKFGFDWLSDFRGEDL